MIKYIKSWFILAILCVFYTFCCSFCVNHGVFFADEIGDSLSDKIAFNTSAKSAILIEAKTGRVLYDKNSEQKLPIASTTKIVTAITVLDNCDNLDRVVTVEKDCVGVEGTSIYLKAGERLSVRELLYGLMLRSGNDASVVLAKHTAGSVEKFCEMMNNTASKLGLKNSSFTNPHGLDSDQHYSTALDLAKITAYALNNEEFKKIVSTHSITIGDGGNTRFLQNKNKLLKNLDGCIGVKTGFTSKAGRCLVSAAERNGLRLVCVVLNCGPMFEESLKMLELGFDNFEMKQAVSAYQTYDDVFVENGTVDKVSTYSRRGFCYPLSKNEIAEMRVLVDLPKSVMAPIKKDVAIGLVEVYIGKHLIFSEKIYTMDKVGSRQITDKIKDIIDNWSA